MKVQNFGRKRIYSAQLPNPLSKKKSRVVVSELELSDRATIKSYINRWEKTTYGGLIIGDFWNNSSAQNSPIGKSYRYFVIECPKIKTKKKMKALSKIYIDSRDPNLYLSFLQSERQLSKSHALTGAGSCLLYTIIKIAKDVGKKSIKVVSGDTAIPFYMKNGFKFSKAIGYVGVLPDCKFDEILRKIKKRFHITKL